MPLAEHVPEGIDLFCRCLDEQLLLLIDLRDALPGIDRSNAGDDGDARGETAADEILRELDRVEVAGQGRQRQHEVAHRSIFSLYRDRKAGTKMPHMTLDSVPDGSGPPPSGPGSTRRRLRSAQELRDRRRKRITVGLSCALCVLLVNSIVGENGYLAGLRLRREQAQLEAIVADLRLQNQRLKEDSYRLEHDPAALEEAARGSLGLIRPGETLLILHSPATPASPSHQ